MNLSPIEKKPIVFHNTLAPHGADTRHSLLYGDHKYGYPEKNPLCN